MKRSILLITLSLLQAFALSACGKDATGNGEEQEPVAGEYSFDAMAGAGAVEKLGYNLFGVELSEQGGKKLVIMFAGSDYYLSEGEYAPASSESGAPGGYITDMSYLESGGNKTYITDGNILVEKDGTNYAMSGSLTLADQTEISFNATGTLSYQPLKEYRMLDIYSVSVIPQGSLTQFTLLMASDGVTATADGDNWIFGGEGIHIDMTLIAGGTTLSPGVYAADEALQDPLAPNFTGGTFVKGYEYMFMGFLPLKAYSNVYRVAGGENLWDSYIEQGEVRVEQKGDIYRITMDCGDFQARFEGRIPDLEEGPGIVVIPHENLSLESTVLEQAILYNIMLPEGYDENTDEEYPILYLLHGLGENNTMWMGRYAGNALNIYNAAYLDGTVPGMIVVMPQAPDVFYMDYEGVNYETFFHTEFMPFIESEYRVRAEKESRFIAGNSMGGFGATYHAISYPEKFALSYSMSGGMVANDQFIEIITAYRDAHGSFEGMPAYFMECGTEDFLCYNMNEELAAMLTEIDFPHSYLRRGGGHGGWDGALERALKEIGNYLKN